MYLYDMFTLHKGTACYQLCDWLGGHGLAAVPPAHSNDMSSSHTLPPVLNGLRSCKLSNVALLPTIVAFPSTSSSNCTLCQDVLSVTVAPPSAMAESLVPPVLGVIVSAAGELRAQTASTTFTRAGGSLACPAVSVLNIS